MPEPAPKYVVLEDLEDYVEGWTTADAGATLRLLGRAERYIDLLGSGYPIQPADPIQSIGISFEEPPTGGWFTVSFTYNGETFVSNEIPYNCEWEKAAEAVNTGRCAATGKTFPNEVETFEGPLTPYVPSGPLPFTTIVMAFVNYAGERDLPAGKVVENKLTGGKGVEPKVTQICPGAPWGGRFNPSKLLSFNQLQGLKNAVCAQASYMFDLGPRFFVEAQYSSVKGPDFATQGKLPHIAPQARRELDLTGLIASMARSRA
jgi:hypothetical protein